MGHRYVGNANAYGGSFAAAMKRELHNRGPITVGFEPRDEFMYYKNGIFRTSEGNRDWNDKFHAGNEIGGMLPPAEEWERVDHAVLLTGYGETPEGEKFWEIQNSWGADWGEQGFFRIAADENESGIESIAEAADVVPAQQYGDEGASTDPRRQVHFLLEGSTSA